MYRRAFTQMIFFSSTLILPCPQTTRSNILTTDPCPIFIPQKAHYRRGVHYQTKQCHYYTGVHGQFPANHLWIFKTFWVLWAAIGFVLGSNGAQQLIATSLRRLKILIVSWGHVLLLPGRLVLTKRPFKTQRILGLVSLSHDSFFNRLGESIVKPFF